MEIKRERDSEYLVDVVVKRQGRLGGTNKLKNPHEASDPPICGTVPMLSEPLFQKSRIRCSLILGGNHPIAVKLLPPSA